jgi:hypothetical protein
LAGNKRRHRRLRAQGLKIVDLEDDEQLQDAVLSIHHACMLTVGNHNVVKLIENHKGTAHLKAVTIQMQQVQMPVQMIPQQPAPQPAAAPPQSRLSVFLSELKAAFARLFARTA